MVFASALIGASLAAYHGYNAYRNYQRGNEYRRMNEDFERHTGRKVKYGKVRGYNNDAWNSYMQAWQNTGKSYASGYGVAHTFSDFTKE